MSRLAAVVLSALMLLSLVSVAVGAPDPGAARPSIATASDTAPLESVAGGEPAGIDAEPQNTSENDSRTLMETKNVSDETTVDPPPVDKQSDFVIPFYSGNVTLDEGLDPVLTDTARERVWAVVQFVETPTDEQLSAYDVVDDALAYNTVFARIPTAQLEAFAAEPYVRAVAHVRPEWRLSPSLDARIREAGLDSEHAVTVVAFAPLDVEGLERTDELVYDDRNDDVFYEGTLTGEQIRALQDHPRVEWIERRREINTTAVPAAPETPLQGLAPVLAAVDRAVPAFSPGDATPLHTSGHPWRSPKQLLVNSHAQSWEGSSVDVGVMDTGIDHGHGHFSSTTIVDSYDWTDNDNDPSMVGDPHGTSAAGIIAGEGTRARVVHTDVPVEGVAPEADLIVGRGGNEDDFGRIRRDGADIISNSWRYTPPNGQYGGATKQTDKWARNNPDTILLFANGNGGAYPAGPGQAKNVVAVGATESGTVNQANPHLVSRLNDMQPLKDGRTKPDVNAPTMIAAPDGSGSYTAFGGTSASTAATAGAVAVIQDAFRRGSGTIGPLDANEMKALLVATSNQVSMGSAFGLLTGHGGVINVNNAIWNNAYEDQQGIYGDAVNRLGKTDRISVDVEPGSEKLVLVLSWMDPAASTNVRDTLVNDLDLVVKKRGGSVVARDLGNDDSLNRLVIHNPSAGTYDVYVKAHDFSYPHLSQEYDLVVREVTDDPALEVGPNRTTVSAPKVAVSGQSDVSASVEFVIDGTGAPVTSVDSELSSFLGSISFEQDCAPRFLDLDPGRSSDEFRDDVGYHWLLAGTVSENDDYRQEVCFEIPRNEDTYEIDAETISVINGSIEVNKTTIHIELTLGDLVPDRYRDRLFEGLADVPSRVDTFQDDLLAGKEVELRVRDATDAERFVRIRALMNEEGRVSEFSESFEGEPDLLVEMTNETSAEVLSSDDPAIVLAEAYEQDRVTIADGDGGRELALTPSSRTVAPNGTTTYDLVFDPASDGVGTYDLNVSVSNTSVATIDGVQPRLGPNPDAPATFNATTVAADGSTVRIQQVGVQSETGNVTLATVTVASHDPGNASLAFSNVVVGDRNDSQYAIDRLRGATLTVRSDAIAPVGPDVNDNGEPATDPDGDDLYEDLDGNGNGNVIDVALLLGALDAPAIQNNVSLFDYNRDRKVNVIDVALLLDRI